MGNDLLEILRDYLGEEPSLEVLTPLVEELVDFIEDIKEEIKESHDGDIEDELAEQAIQFEVNPLNYITKKELLIAKLLGINDTPSLADEVKIEWFINNYDKINPYKDL